MMILLSFGGCEMFDGFYQPTGGDESEEVNSEPTEALLGYIQKDSSHTATVWINDNTKSTHTVTLTFSDDKVRYTLLYLSFDTYNKPYELYDCLYYTTGTDTSATFKGVVDDESITVKLSEINGDTMKQVMYKGNSTVKYFEETLVYDYSQ